MADEQQIFDIASEITDPSERALYINAACEGDTQLLDRINRLLECYGTETTFLSEQQILAGREANSDGLIGKHVGRYSLLEEIGEGGFGVVYLAEQREPVQRQVALKIVKPGMETRHLLARFEAERQALALMDHPHIARVLDGGTTDEGRPYFVMELVDGEPIIEFYDEHQFGLINRLQLFKQVCLAIQHAHQKGIIHRDIKPSNVLVTFVNGVAVPRVIDFGIAKAIDESVVDCPSATHMGQVLGTPQYMSPEQAAARHQDIDTRTDVYGLGVMLFELLTGRTPIDKERIQELGTDEWIRLIQEQEATAPSAKLSTVTNIEAKSIGENRRAGISRLRQSIKGELDWVTLKALNKERDRRYASPGELAGDIDRYLKQEPVLAGPPSAIYKLRKFVRRNRALIGSIVAVSSSIVVGVAALFYGLTQSLRNEQALRKQTELAAESWDLLSVILAPTSSISGSDPDQTVVEMLDEAAKNLDEKLEGKSSAVRAKYRGFLGNAFNARGATHRAYPIIKAAADDRRRQGDELALANALLKQGQAAHFICRPDLVMDPAMEAEKLFAEMGDARQQQLAGKLRAEAELLGRMTVQIRQTLTNLKHHEFIEEIKSQVDEHDLVLGGMLISYATQLMIDLGEYDFAKKLLRDRLARVETDPSTTMAHNAVATTNFILGEIAEVEGQTKRAEAHFRTTVEWIDRVSEIDADSRWLDGVELRAKFKLGPIPNEELPEAEQKAQVFVDWVEEMVARGPVATMIQVMAYQALAQVRHQQNRLDEAIEIAEQALEVSHAGHRHLSDELEIEVFLSETLVQNGQANRARQIAQDALDRREELTSDKYAEHRRIVKEELSEFLQN